VKLEGEPTRSDHSAITKCLVDRFGWTVASADRATDSAVSVFYVRMDSIEQVVKDSLARAELAWRQTQDSIAQEARRTAFVAELRTRAEVHPWVSSDSTGLFYRRTCREALRIKGEDRREWSDSTGARAAGFHRSTTPGC
jgi:hypothetical protein